LEATVYDAGVLVAAARNERSAWAEHVVRLSAGIIPLVSANVVAQVSRSPKQAQLRRFLRGCEVVSFDEKRAHRAGALLGRAKTSDVVDASVVELAIARDAEILTTDPHDIGRLVAASGKRIPVIAR
jgi:predicted nucleic acid-binding protein